MKKRKNLKNKFKYKFGWKFKKIKSSRQKSRQKINFGLKNFYLAGATVLISVLVIFTVVKAGNLTPSASPAATSYTLEDIYLRLTANTAATEANHNLSTTTAPLATFYTLKQIYNAIPTIVAAKVLSGTTYLGIAGTMANNGAQTITPGTSNTAITVGYHNGSGYCAGDTDLVSTNIKSGITIFGIDGNGNVVDTSAGDAVAGDIANDKIAFVDGSQITGSMFTNQKNQTKDDYSSVAGQYTAEEASWNAVSGSPFSGYDTINYLGGTNLYSGAVKQDTRTGLWWSDIMAVGAVASTTSNNFNAVTDGSRPTGGQAIGFCDALNTANFGGHNDWYLPTQKQLMQAYIDGSDNNLLSMAGTFWSSSELSWDSTFAWRVNLVVGSTGYTIKVNSSSYNVICVRP